MEEKDSLDVVICGSTVKSWLDQIQQYGSIRLFKLTNTNKDSLICHLAKAYDRLSLQISCAFHHYADDRAVTTWKIKDINPEFRYVWIMKEVYIRGYNEQIIQTMITTVDRSIAEDFIAVLNKPKP